MPLSVPVMVGMVCPYSNDRPVTFAVTGSGVIVSTMGVLVIAAFWLSPPKDTTRLWVPADNVETLIEATLLERPADATVVELLAVSNNLT